MSLSVLESQIQELDLSDPRLRLLPGPRYDPGSARIYLPSRRLRVEVEAWLAPDATDSTDTSGVTDAADAPETTDTAEASETTDTADAPETTDTAEASETTDTVEASETTDTVEASEPADTADTADAPEGRLRSALAELGVEAAVIDSLTALSMACATVATTGQVPAETPCPRPTAREGKGKGKDGTARPGGDRFVDRVGADAPATLARARALLDAVEALTTLPGHLEALLLQATRQLTGMHGKLLLAAKGAASPEELNSEQREKWRARAKKVTRHEIEAVTGWGAGEVLDLVAMANTLAVVDVPVQHALCTGHASWRLARRYYRATTTLDTLDSAAIANAFFGDDPRAAVTERLDSHGQWLGGPWRHKEFYRALDREVAKINARDPETTTKARTTARQNADVTAILDQEGTASLNINCDNAQAAAITDRIERAARAARKAGDPRNLRQLRCAVATALLLHGTLDTNTLPQDPTLITTEHTEQLGKILHGLPTATLNVIVPLNTLLGTPAHATASAPVPDAFRNPACTCTCGADQPRQPGQTGHPCPPTGPAGQQTPATAPSTDPPDAAAGAGADRAGADRAGAGGVGFGEIGVGEILGRHRMFLSPGQARALALTPGSTMYRLLTDPATGRCVERSSTAYRFDAGMRAQIIAADGFCRVPGCMIPAAQCQIDHVQEYGTPGGETREANGQALHEAHHDLKTKKEWDAVLHENRDITWTTLLGRIYTTKAHDYTQYTKLLTAATTAIDTALATGTAPDTALNEAIYQALSYRHPAAPFHQPEDTPGHQDDFTGWDLITLTHTTPTGQRAYRPHPETTQAEHERHTTTRTPTTDANNAPTSDDQQDRDKQTHENQAGQGKTPDAQPNQNQTGGRASGTSPSDNSGNAGTTPWDEPHNDPPPF